MSEIHAAPDSDTEMVLQFTPIITSLLRRKGYFGPRLEDATQEVWLWILRIDYRNKWDGVRDFRTYIIGIIIVRVANFIRAEMLRNSRERLLADTTDEDGIEMDVADRAADDPYVVAREHEVLQDLKDFAAVLDTRYPPTQTTSFGKLLLALVSQVEATGQRNETEIGRIYGMAMAGRPFSRQAIAQQLAKLIALPEMKALRLRLGF
jgi:DNA-directed RNA polymerase specialized sigma24 family protein